MYRCIKLTQNKSVILDEQDVDLCDINWYANKSGGLKTMDDLLNRAKDIFEESYEEVVIIY